MTIEKIRVLILTLIIFCSCRNDFKVVSRKIWKQNTFSQISYTPHYNHKIREYLFKEHKFEFVNMRNDTFYVFNYLVIESGGVYGLIWNQSGEMSYKDDQNEKSFKSLIITDRHNDPDLILMKKYAEDWDTTHIAEMHAAHIHKSPAWLSRAIVNEKRTSVITFNFEW